MILTMQSIGVARIKIMCDYIIIYPILSYHSIVKSGCCPMKIFFMIGIFDFSIFVLTRSNINIELIKYDRKSTCNVF
jgi:hypothetical protein